MAHLLIHNPKTNIVTIQQPRLGRESEWQESEWTVKYWSNGRMIVSYEVGDVPHGIERHYIIRECIDNNIYRATWES